MLETLRRMKDKAQATVGDKVTKVWTKAKQVAKKSTSYVWDMTQIGMARGHSLFDAIGDAFGINSSTHRWMYTFFALHGSLSFFKKFFNEKPFKKLAKIAVASKEIQASILYIPLFVSLLSAFGATSQPALLGSLIGSASLSIGYRVLSKIKKHLNKKSLLSNRAKATSFFYDKVFSPLMSIAKIGGQFAVGRVVFLTFLEFYAYLHPEQLNMNIINHPAFLALIITPMALELIRYPTAKLFPKSNLVSTFSVGLLSTSKAFEALGFNTLLLARLIDPNSNNPNLTNDQVIAVLAVGACLSAISGIKETRDQVVRLRKLRVQLVQSTQSDIESGITHKNNFIEGSTDIMMTKLVQPTTTTDSKASYNNHRHFANPLYQQLTKPLLESSNEEKEPSPAPGSPPSPAN